MRLTEKEVDRAIFKVPTLRNIELTAPYMHDGSFSSLQEVIENYKIGGKGNKNQSNIIQPFKLNTKQEADLINFLKSLTDYEFISNPDFNVGTDN
jgi:cytochrome c peroxidase